MTTKAAGRRSEIIEVATRLFSERGYAATSLEDIAEVIGFTKPAIYYYFGSKDEILFEIHDGIVRVGLERVEAIREAGGNPADQLDQVLREHIARLLDNVEANLVFAREQAALSEDRAADIRDRDRAYERAVRAIYVDGVADGSFKDIDPRVAVGSLLAACNWAHRWYRTGGEYSTDDVADMIVGLLMGGYLE
ncbi:MAG TPA: TetR/AcrR family transcriptional regulator [Acidimicrobiia bacterium]|nr:TetR/AcrR family transcriptional regulator [Acidimicrobiia bacterium]